MVKNFTVKFMLENLSVCYTEKRLEKLWGKKESLTALEILSLNIPSVDKMWFMRENNPTSWNEYTLGKRLMEKICRRVFENILDKTEKMFSMDEYYSDLIKKFRKLGVYRSISVVQNIRFYVDDFFESIKHNKKIKQVKRDNQSEIFSRWEELIYNFFNELDCYKRSTLFYDFSDLFYYEHLEDEFIRVVKEVLVEEENKSKHGEKKNRRS